MALRHRQVRRVGIRRLNRAAWPTGQPERAVPRRSNRSMRPVLQLVLSCSASSFHVNSPLREPRAKWSPLLRVSSD
jgi:hypothetical protein